VSLDLCRRLKDKGALLLLERINCHTAYAAASWTPNTPASGGPSRHDISDELIRQEYEENELAGLHLLAGTVRGFIPGATRGGSGQGVAVQLRVGTSGPGC